MCVCVCVCVCNKKENCDYELFYTSIKFKQKTSLQNIFLQRKKDFKLYINRSDSANASSTKLECILQVNIFF